MQKKLFLLFLIGVGAFLALPAFAQIDITDDDVNRVANELFCPTCESMPVDVCPTEVCADWRAEIRRQLEEGATDDEILDYFAVRYGTGVLANPPAEGLGNFFWIGPILVVLLGLFIFGRQMQKLQTEAAKIESNPDLGSQPESSGDPYRDRIEQELSR